MGKQQGQNAADDDEVAVPDEISGLFRQTDAVEVKTDEERGVDVEGSEAGKEEVPAVGDGDDGEHVEEEKRSAGRVVQKERRDLEKQGTEENERFIKGDDSQKEYGFLFYVVLFLEKIPDDGEHHAAGKHSVQAYIKEIELFCCQDASPRSSIMRPTGKKGER
jgi:hypothetical protein